MRSSENSSTRARRHGVHLALFKQLTSDLPDEVIADGFGVLSDEQLADIAIDPSALHALSDYLWCELDPDSELPEPEWGDWWWKAVSSGEAPVPGLAPSVVANASAPPAPPPKEEAIIPFDPSRTTGRPRATGWLGQAGAALAASLLLGVFLGKTAFDGGGEGSGSFPLASSSPVYGPGRGAERGPRCPVRKWSSRLRDGRGSFAGESTRGLPRHWQGRRARAVRHPTEFSPLPPGIMM